MQKPALQYVDASIAIDEVFSILDRDGVICIRNLLPKSELVNLKNELTPHFEQSSFCEGSFVGNQTKRIHSLVAKSSAFRGMATHPTVLKIMDHVLGPSCDKFLLNITQGIQIWPGERGQTIHRDDSMFPVRTHDCELMADVIWAYDDFTNENGATVIVPGSHKWTDRNRIPKPEECTQAEMKAGDALIYVGSLLHNGGANKSNAPRTGILVSYALGWLRQFENQFLVAPPAIARTYDRQLQDLLGYTVHRPNLGLYEGNDPSIVFDMPDAKGLITHDYLTPLGYSLVEKAREYEDAGKKLPDRIDDLLAAG